VVSDDGTIDIDPTDPDEIYLPDYQPDTIYSQPECFALSPRLSHWVWLGSIGIGVIII